MASGTFDDYLAGLAEDRRPVVERVVGAIRDGIDPRFEESMQHGLPAWVVPMPVYPGGYHCKPSDPVPYMQVASRAKQIVVYSMAMYARADWLAWFEDEYAKLDLGRLERGKSCLYFKKLDRIPLELIGELAGKVSLYEYVEHYRTFDPRETP